MRELETPLAQQLHLAPFARLFDLSTDEAERRAAEGLMALADACDHAIRAQG